MPFLDPEKRRAYHRAYQKTYQQRTQADRKRQLRKRIAKLMALPWTRCGWRMFCHNPCRKKPRWRNGNAIYCDIHKHKGAVPLEEIGTAGRPALGDRRRGKKDGESEPCGPVCAKETTRQPGKNGRSTVAAKRRLPSGEADCSAETSG